VPVLEEDGAVVADSTAIFEYLEERYPERPLYPLDEARRTELRLFVDWFDRVWKRPPNLLVDLGSDDPRVTELAEALERSLGTFEALLARRDFLYGELFTAADAAAFPFLKYAVALDPSDADPFHHVLARHLALEGRYPRVEAWIRRVDALPRA